MMLGPIPGIYTSPRRTGSSGQAEDRRREGNLRLAEADLWGMDNRQLWLASRRVSGEGPVGRGSAGGERRGAGEAA